MLSLGKFPTTVRHGGVVGSPQFSVSSKFRPPVSVSKPLSLNGCVLRNRLLCAARGSKGKGEFEEDDDGEFGEDEVVVPMEEMKKWLENRPRGFGEGRVYDTSIEDDLVKEIEQSRKAQAANIAKLKENKKESDKLQNEGSARIDSAFRVRVTNLPKKKNIHRDLRLAFSGVAGIVAVTPVVSGNEKTRDPVCKGLAFVDFDRLPNAHRFVQDFSGRTISFGKVQKEIKCEIISTESASDDPKLDIIEDSSAPLDDRCEESDPSRSNGADHEMHLPDVSIPADDDNESPSSPKQGRKPKGNEKARRKGKNPKSSIILGSAKRLKIKEKALLTGVLSKYGQTDR
ncbi:uncharacterized protein LOC127245248 [Andrographis paniculata]|uniref:uncharacterized protein LOC127245248 n=1 Tax=Andrographis paniculata TaxID=175694 RepID=UPI0021E738A9|nr:uncharacterized protein LOC127245248 [Andrographis paniculata]